MKKVKFFNQKRYRSIKPEEMRRCSNWFNKDSFYFFTKRPDSLVPGNVDEILNKSIVFINEKDKPVGLLKSDSEFLANFYTLMTEFRFADEEFYTNSMAERIFFNFIHDLFFVSNKFLNKIMFRVFSFDQLNRDFLEGFEIKQEACLKNLIYKFGQFNDLIIYGITRDEYLKDNNLKG